MRDEDITLKLKISLIGFSPWKVVLRISFIFDLIHTMFAI
jgi:hypothetical protein